MTPTLPLHSTVSPNPNILIELFHALHNTSQYRPTSPTTEKARGQKTYASQTTSTSTPLILAITYATNGIVAGSFRPFTMAPLTHLSFFTALGTSGAAPSFQYRALA